MTDQPMAVGAQQLTPVGELIAAIGPSVGYHISQCRAGGYVVIVDGRIHSACTTLIEAVNVMGRVASEQYGEPAQVARVPQPEPADDVKNDPLMPIGPMPAEGRVVPRAVRPPEKVHQTRPALSAPALQRLRTTAGAALIAIVAGSARVMGV